MTRQELFDKAYLGLHAQGWKQAANTNGTCRYRQGKLKCAIGQVIPDELYRNSMEGSMLRDVLEVVDFDPLDWQWAGRLQDVHDNNPDPEFMKQSFEEFANYEGLTIPEVA